MNEDGTMMGASDNAPVPMWLHRKLMDRLDLLIKENQSLRDRLGMDIPQKTPKTKAKIVHLSPLDGYKRHIAHANHIIYNEVLHNLNDEQQ